MHYDAEMARICTWLKKNRLTAHVTLIGKITLRKKLLTTSRTTTERVTVKLIVTGVKTIVEIGMAALESGGSVDRANTGAQSMQKLGTS